MYSNLIFTYWFNSAWTKSCDLKLGIKLTCISLPVNSELFVSLLNFSASFLMIFPAFFSQALEELYLVADMPILDQLPMKITFLRLRKRWVFCLFPESCLGVYNWSLVVYKLRDTSDFTQCGCTHICINPFLDLKQQKPFLYVLTFLCIRVLGFGFWLGFLFVCFCLVGWFCYFHSMTHPFAAEDLCIAALRPLSSDL